MCVDPASVSLHMINLHSEAEMTQIPLQVKGIISNFLFCETKIVYPFLCSMSMLVLNILLFYSVFKFISQFPLRNSFLQSLGLEVSPSFRPVLISSQPNPARQPLSEFFLQLGPEHYHLLQLNNGQIVTLRDFNPVRSTLSCFFFCFVLMCLSVALVTASICCTNMLNCLY